MEEVRVGIVGLGNVGSGTLAILAENADQIALKLGFRLKVAAVCSPSVGDRAIRAGINLAMEASVCGGIPIHAVLREGISGDRVSAISGILNGTSNFILTEMERRGESFETILAEAQALGYAEADPSADVDGYDARSKLAILS